MRFWSQNLNEKSGDIVGSMIRAGRAALYITDRASVRAEWSLWSRLRILGVALDLAQGDDTVVQIGLHFWWAHVWLSFDYWKWQQWLSNKIRRRDQKYGNGRALGLELGSDLTLRLSLWEDPMEWRKVDPAWWKLSINLPDFFLGQPAYSERNLRTERISVPMPEGIYNGTARFFESTWKRSRWPWPTRMVRADIKMDVPVGVPGKGENSWDLDDDAVFSMTTQATNATEAAAAIFNSVMRTRSKYGSKDWLPQGMKRMAVVEEAAL